MNQSHQLRKDYLPKAKEIITKHNLESYIDALLDHWEENPTTLGHGFEHVLDAAVVAYELGVLNDYSDPKTLFIYGLFHDIYRPVRGEGGKESHHHESAQIIDEMFTRNGFDEKIKNMLIDYMEADDDWIGKPRNEIPERYILFFYADKSGTDHYMTQCYIWASNKYASENGLPAFYENDLQALADFAIYQKKFWLVFKLYPIKGRRAAADAIIDAYMHAVEGYKKDPEGDKYKQRIDTTAEEVRGKEREYLLEFRDEESTKKIMRDME